MLLGAEEMLGIGTDKPYDAVQANTVPGLTRVNSPRATRVDSTRLNGTGSRIFFAGVAGAQLKSTPGVLEVKARWLSPCSAPSSPQGANQSQALQTNPQSSLPALAPQCFSVRQEDRFNYQQFMGRLSNPAFLPIFSVTRQVIHPFQTDKNED